MSPTVERIRNEAKTLPLKEREALLAMIDYDLYGLQPEVGEITSAQADEAWDAEIDSRVTEFESGKVKLLTHDEFISVFDEAREEFRRTSARA